MKIVLLYLRILKKSDPNYQEPKDYEESAKRFLASYQNYKPKIDHELVIVNCGNDQHDGMFDCAATRYETDLTGGFDCGSWKHVGARQDCDFVIGLNTHTYFWRHGWLEPFAKAFNTFGMGVYGPTASYEQNAHLRTPCIAFSPDIACQYPHPVDDRYQAGLFEFGPDNFSLWAHRSGYPVRLVVENMTHGIESWRTPRNGFRSGNQSDCLVRDRHTEIYANADPSYKRHLELAANGIKI